MALYAADTIYGQDISFNFECEDDEIVTPDKALDYIGGFGRFQKLSTIMFMILFGVNSPFVFGFPAFEKPPKLICWTVDNPDVKFACDISEACNNANLRYEIDEENSLINWVNDFNLTCVSNVGIGLIGSLFFIGYLVGSGVIMRLADFHGRKALCAIGIIAQSLLMMLLVSVKRLDALYIIIFLFGVLMPTRYQVTYIWGIELMPSNWRSTSSSIIQIVDSFANYIVALYFYFFKDWKPFTLLLALATAAMLPIVLIWPESPRYFISVGKYDEARKVYLKIAKTNKAEMFEMPLEGERSDSTGNKRTVMKRRVQGLFEVLTHREFLAKALVFCYAWFTVDLLFFGTNFNLKYYSDDLILNLVLTSTADVIATMISGYVAHTFGRKIGLSSCFFLSTLGFFLYTFVNSYNAFFVQTTLFIAVLGAAGALNIIQMFTFEAFPTSIRGSVFGIVNVCAKIGGFTAPMLVEVTTHTVLVFGACSLAAGILCFVLLKETMGIEVKDRKDRNTQIGLLGAAGGNPWDKEQELNTYE